MILCTFAEKCLMRPGWLHTTALFWQIVQLRFYSTVHAGINVDARKICAVYIASLASLFITERVNVVWLAYLWSTEPSIYGSLSSWSDQTPKCMAFWTLIFSLSYEWIRLYLLPSFGSNCLFRNASIRSQIFPDSSDRNALAFLWMSRFCRSIQCSRYDERPILDEPAWGSTTQKVSEISNHIYLINERQNL